MHEVASQRANFSKISRGSMPPDLPRNLRLRRSQISLAEKLLQLKRTPPPRLETRLRACILTYVTFEKSRILPFRLMESRITRKFTVCRRAMKRLQITNIWIKWFRLVISFPTLDAIFYIMSSLNNLLQTSEANSKRATSSERFGMEIC